MKYQHIDKTQGIVVHVDVVTDDGEHRKTPLKIDWHKLSEATLANIEGVVPDEFEDAVNKSKTNG
mgnify:FL=1